MNQSINQLGFISDKNDNNEHLYSSQKTDTDRKTDMYKRNKNYKTTHIIHQGWKKPRF